MGEGRRPPDPDPLQNELIEAQMSYELFSGPTPGPTPSSGVSVGNGALYIPCHFVMSSALMLLAAVSESFELDWF